MRNPMTEDTLTTKDLMIRSPVGSGELAVPDAIYGNVECTVFFCVGSSLDFGCAKEIASFA